MFKFIWSICLLIRGNYYSAFGYLVTWSIIIKRIEIKPFMKVTCLLSRQELFEVQFIIFYGNLKQEMCYEFCPLSQTEQHKQQNLIKVIFKGFIIARSIESRNLLMGLFRYSDSCNSAGAWNKHSELISLRIIFQEV